ncbi:MAG TPA: extracellular solute-binding protein [Thermomicrobiales bacterium]|nr:extracellular solute-binding protein [Thermomicrobiales bacterium]
MKALSRRSFVAATAAVTATGAASTRFAMPAVIGAQAKPIEITFYHIWGTPPGAAAKSTKHPADQVIDAFNASQTAIKVNAQTPATDYATVEQKLQADLAAGNPPALCTIPWANINYANEGLGIVPLDTIAGSDLKSVTGNILPDVLPLAQIGTQTMGLPYALSTPIAFYNADILKQAGVDPAVLFKDWESFAQEGPKVQSALGGGNPVLAISYNKDWPSQGIIQSNGGRVLDDSGQPAMNSAEAEAAMQAIADLDKAGLYDRGTSQELRPNWIGGSTAVMISSSAGVGSVKTDATFTWSTAPTPAFAGKKRQMSTGGSFIGCFAKDDDQRAAAWTFLKYANSESATKLWAQTGYLNSTTWDLPVLPGQESGYAQLKEGLTRETPWPGAHGAEMQATWGGYVERIWAEDISVKDGCEEAVSDLKSILAQS